MKQRGMVEELHIIPHVQTLQQLESPWKLGGGSTIPLTFKQKSIQRPNKIPTSISEIRGKLACESHMPLVQEVRIHFPSEHRHVGQPERGDLDKESIPQLFGACGRFFWFIRLYHPKPKRVAVHPHPSLLKTFKQGGREHPSEPLQGVDGQKRLSDDGHIS